MTQAETGAMQPPAQDNEGAGNSRSGRRPGPDSPRNPQRNQPCNP